MKKVWMALAVLALSCGLAQAEDKLWTENFESAKAQAAKEGKDLLIDFTGSDWCGWCVRLKKEVFDTDLFKKEATKNFVLVELDFPRATEQAEEIKTQNEALQQKFGIQGFPTIVLANAQGEEYARTGYAPGGPGPYLKQLLAKRQMNAELPNMLKTAEQAEGLARAKALDALVAAQLELGKEPDAKHFDEIMKLDADGKAGLKVKYEALKFEDQLAKASESEDGAQFKELLDKGILRTDFPAETRQRMLRAKGLMIFKQDSKAGFKLLQDALALAPDSPTAEAIKQMIPQLEMYLKMQQGGGAEQK